MRRPPQRDDGRARSPTAAAGWASRSTPTPRWTSTAWSRSCAQYGTERVLVNSAADWGSSDPLQDPQDRRGDARRRLHRRRRRPGAVAQPGRRSTARAAGSTSTGPGRDAADAAHLRGQLDPARRRAPMRLRHPDGTVVHLAYCTNVHPAEDLDGVLAQLDALRRPGARAPRRSTALGVGLWLPRRRRRPRWPPTADACARLRARARRARPRGASPSTPSPTRPSTPRWSSTRVYRPDWTDPAAPATTPSTAPGVLAELLPDDAAAAASRPCRWAGATPGRADRPTRPHAGSSTRWPRGWRELADATGRTDPARASSPSPAACVETVDRGASPAAPRVDQRPASASASTPATSPSPSRTRRRAAPGSTARRPAASSRCRPRPRCTSRTRPTRRPAPRSPPSSSRATCTRPARSARRLVLGADDLPEALDGRCPTTAPGACTSTCRCTPRRPPPLARPPRRAARRAGARWSAAPTARRDHLEVETYTWSVLPDGAPADDDASSPASPPSCAGRATSSSRSA